MSEFNSTHDSGIVIEHEVIHVAVGSAGIFITIVVVASILIFIFVRRSKPKRKLILLFNYLCLQYNTFIGRDRKPSNTINIYEEIR